MIIEIKKIISMIYCFFFVTFLIHTSLQNDEYENFILIQFIYQNKNINLKKVHNSEFHAHAIVRCTIIKPV